MDINKIKPGYYFCYNSGSNKRVFDKIVKSVDLDRKLICSKNGVNYSINEITIDISVTRNKKIKEIIG